MRSPLQETEESKPATKQHKRERFSASGDVSPRCLTSSSTKSRMELPPVDQVETEAKTSRGPSHYGLKKERFRRKAIDN